MEQMTPECFGIWGLALAVIVAGFVLASVISSRRERLTGPDATDDDTPTADGEPADVADSVIYVYRVDAPDHLPALGYVRVPSQQRRVRLDVEARDE